jgi:hypothetical protein
MISRFEKVARYMSIVQQPTVIGESTQGRSRAYEARNEIRLSDGTERTSARSLTCQADNAGRPGFYGLILEMSR